MRAHVGRAIRNGDVAMVEYLLEKGADPNGRSSGKDAMLPLIEVGITRPHPRHSPLR